MQVGRSGTGNLIVNHREVREMRTAETVLNIIRDPNSRPRLLESRVIRKSVKRGSGRGGWKRALWYLAGRLLYFTSGSAGGGWKHRSSCALAAYPTNAQRWKLTLIGSTSITRCHRQLQIRLLSVGRPGRWAMNNEFIQGHEWET